MCDYEFGLVSVTARKSFRTPNASESISRIRLWIMLYTKYQDRLYTNLQRPTSHNPVILGTTRGALRGRLGGGGRGLGGARRGGAWGLATPGSGPSAIRRLEKIPM